MRPRFYLMVDEERTHSFIFMPRICLDHGGQTTSYVVAVHHAWQAQGGVCGMHSP